MKIIVAGAGIGGLKAAALLAAGGHEVTVYEKRRRDELTSDWYEDVEPKLFDDTDAKLPEGSYKAEDLTLVPPFSDDNIEINMTEGTKKLRISRKAFLEQLIADCEQAGVNFEFYTSVKKVIVKGTRIAGVIINKEKYYCDLVIDSSGVNSSIRRSLPDDYGITKEITENDYYSVFRGIFDYYPGCPVPKNKKKMFLKFMGQSAFARVICEPNDRVDIMVGKVGRMSRFEFETMLRQLRIENQVIGYEDLMPGKFAKLPVRYPLTKMVADGYAAVGNSAFMTVPMIGNGIADAYRAGQLLAQAVLEGGNSSAKMLWKYQVSYYNKYGPEKFMVDMMRRTLFNSKPNDVRFLLQSGFFTKDEIKTAAQGKPLDISISFLFSKLGIGKSNFKFFTETYFALSKGKKAMDLAKQIPNKYDPAKIAAWQSKIEKLYK